MPGSGVTPANALALAEGDAKDVPYGYRLKRETSLGGIKRHE